MGSPNPYALLYVWAHWTLQIGLSCLESAMHLLQCWEPYPVGLLSAPAHAQTDPGPVWPGKWVLTISYHPQVNAMVERCHAHITKSLKKLVANCPARWPYFIPPMTFAINPDVCSSTNFSPFFRTFGREADQPVDRWMPYWPHTSHHPEQSK
jgi:hypothetical protein